MRLEITRRADLAVRALTVLADADGRVKGPDLAAALDTTPGFVPQVLGPLVAAGWVRSDPGPTGGYRLTARLQDITVLEVVEAVEGPTDLGRCVVADRPCGSAGPCALHVAWARARGELMTSLGGLAMADVKPVEP
ncbi:MAG TPA: Rrf2 family transcriptional regulator [Acidimicrobiales bacterium]